MELVMEKGGTLTSAVNRQQAWDQHKSDVTMVTQDMQVEWIPEQADFGLYRSDSSEDAPPNGHRFSDHSLTQFCNVTGMDRGLWQRVREEGNTTVAESWESFVNTSLEEEFGLGRSNPTRLLRLYDDGGDMKFLRACLSSRYSPINNLEILGRTQSALDELDRKGIRFEVFQISQDIDRMWIRLISTEKISHGEGYLYAGVTIGNSEDGTQVLSCQGFLGDSFCTNGLVFGMRTTEQQREAVLHRKHIGTTSEILKHRFNLAIADSFQMSCDMMERFLGLKNKAVESPLDTIVAIVKARKGKPGFNDSFSKEAQGAFPIYHTQHGDNFFSVISAITQAAQNLKDQDRVVVEKEMGSLVDNLTATVT
jgi:hypothetical protein